MKIGYLAAILKRYKYFIFFPEIWLWLVYIYGVKIIKKFRWENGFLRGFHGTPLCTNRRAGYFKQLSVKAIMLLKLFIAKRLKCRSMLHNVDVFDDFRWTKLCIKINMVKQSKPLTSRQQKRGGEARTGMPLHPSLSHSCEYTDMQEHTPLPHSIYIS